jgi:hypothetical protein
MVNEGGIKKIYKQKIWRDLHTLQDVGVMCALSGLCNREPEKNWKILIIEDIFRMFVILA